MLTKNGIKILELVRLNGISSGKFIMGQLNINDTDFQKEIRVLLKKHLIEAEGFIFNTQSIGLTQFGYKPSMAATIDRILHNNL